MNSLFSRNPIHLLLLLHRLLLAYQATALRLLNLGAMIILQNQ